MPHHHMFLAVYKLQKDERFILLNDQLGAKAAAIVAHPTREPFLLNSDGSTQTLTIGPVVPKKAAAA